MNRIIAENDLNNTQQYQDDMLQPALTMQQVQYFGVHDAAKQPISSSDDVQPMMITVDSCNSIEDMVMMAVEPAVVDGAGHLRIKTQGLQQQQLDASYGNNNNLSSISQSIDYDCNMSTTISPAPSSVCGDNQDGAVIAMSDCATSDGCASPTTSMMMLSSEAVSMTPLEEAEEAQVCVRQRAQSDLSEMKMATYWKDVSAYKESIFDHFGARHIPLETTTEDVIKSVLRESDLSEEPFYVLDLSRLVRQFLQWRELLPRVQPFYAVKCNDSPVMIQVLGRLGCKFDCASQHEIDLVKKLATALDPTMPPLDPATGIIFANPCKQISHCKYAGQAGVEMTTADNEAELRKIKKHWPGAKIVLRIKTDDSMSICQFSTKFGASVELGEAERLIALCAQLGLQFHGVSFHVGSGCQSAQSFVAAVRNARKLFDISRGYGFDPKFLDIGGGFPGVDGQAAVDFFEIAAAVSPVLDELFEDDVTVIGEPGRYFACAPYSLVCNVFAKRDKKVALGGALQQQAGAGKPQAEVLYYINDGVYGGFNCIVFDHAHPELIHLPADEVYTDGPAQQQPVKMRLSTVFGPTCDSADKICDAVPMPDMAVGDYVYIKQFGSYTVASSSAFNGFKVTKIVPVWRQ